MKSEKIDLICEAILKFQNECPPILKDTKVNAGPKKYSYAQLEDIIQLIKPKMKECKLAVSQGAQCVGPDKFVIETLLMHTSGQWISCQYPLYTSGHEQNTGASVTYARRYSLCGILGVNSEKDDDCNELVAKKTYMKPADKPAFYDDPNHPSKHGDGFKIDDTTLEGWRCKASNKEYAGKKFSDLPLEKWESYFTWWLNKEAAEGRTMAGYAEEIGVMIKKYKASICPQPEYDGPDIGDAPF